MRRLPHLPVLLVGLVLLLTGLAILGRSDAAEDEAAGRSSAPSLSVHSNRPDGARALALWLAELGYRPVPIEYRPFAIDPAVDLLFLLTPTIEFSAADLAQIDGWVRQGGTLVIVVEWPDDWHEDLGFAVRQRAAPLAEAVPRQPVFGSLSPHRVQAEATAELRLEPNWVPLLGGSGPGDGEGVIAAVKSVGNGRIFVVSAKRPLSNAGLGQADNWWLLPYLLADVPAGATIAFDEYHHGLTEHGTLAARLVREPWGWAILSATGLLLAYVALRGRRFGRAVPPLPTGTRRSRGEYVATLAALLRQGRHRDWLRRQYAGQFKRAVGFRYGIPADLPARDFVAALAARRPEAGALTAPLERLEGAGRLDDAAVVVLMRELETARARFVE